MRHSSPRSGFGNGAGSLRSGPELMQCVCIDREANKANRAVDKPRSERGSVSRSTWGAASQSLPKRSDWPGCCESQIRAPGRGSVSRSTSAGTQALGRSRDPRERSCCESQTRAPERGSVSRSTSASDTRIGITKRLGAAPSCCGSQIRGPSPGADLRRLTPAKTDDFRAT
jgi:hypothetical protein